MTYQSQKRWEEAVRLQEQATNGYIKIYGHENPDIRVVAANLELMGSMQRKRLAAVDAETTSVVG
jgi:hypothetical protein